MKSVAACVCAVCAHPYGSVHIEDGCKVSKALSRGMVLHVSSSCFSFVHATCAIEDNMIDCKCDNSVLESQCTVLL